MPFCVETVMTGKQIWNSNANSLYNCIFIFYRCTCIAFSQGINCICKLAADAFIGGQEAVEELSRQDAATPVATPAPSPPPSPPTSPSLHKVRQQKLAEVVAFLSREGGVEDHPRLKEIDVLINKLHAVSLSNGARFRTVCKSRKVHLNSQVRQIVSKAKAKKRAASAPAIPAESRFKVVPSKRKKRVALFKE